MLFLNLLVIAFMIATIVRCYKDEIRLKWLFMLVILSLGYVGFSHVGGEVFVSFGLWIGLRFSAYEIYPGGDFAAIVVIPTGAIIYWCIRKWQIRKTAERNIYSGNDTEEDA
jgi:disulfide bond formation protein DsbB